MPPDLKTQIPAPSACKTARPMLAGGRICMTGLGPESRHWRLTVCDMRGVAGKFAAYRAAKII